MAQFFRENIPQVVKASNTSLTLAATYQNQSTHALIGGQAYSLSSALTLNTGTTGAGGIDTGTFTANSLYYCYLIVSSNTPALVISLNSPSTGPTGFSQYKYLARFRSYTGSAGIADVNSDGTTEKTAGSSDWASYTPTTTITNTTRDASFYRRSADNIEIGFAVTGTGAFGTNYTYDQLLPSGLTINTLKLAAYAAGAENDVASIGSWFGVDAGSSTYTGIVRYNVSAALIAPHGISFSPGSGDGLQLTFSVPISEWAGVFT